MHFKHPEILYALFLLIIPIIVHLFQLQRFVKVPFTNVKFLKKIQRETRKSSRLKKLLVLASRLLIFTCLIVAFSQPYYSNYSKQQQFNTNIYLDNSFSMQAKGEHGELLKHVANTLFENMSRSQHPISVFTNDRFLKNVNDGNLKNELLTIPYNPNHLALSTVLLSLNTLEVDTTNTINNNIIISDFQTTNLNQNFEFLKTSSPLKLVQVLPKKHNNIYIDSIYISDKTFSEVSLTVVIKSVLNNNEYIPISLFNDSKLVGKATAKFDNSNQETVQFTIPKTSQFKGKISLIDAVLEFDNDFYFSISKPVKINVLSIGESVEFLTRIYTENEFNFILSSIPKLNYNAIQDQHLIILNELETIPVELMNSLIQFLKNGGDLVVIPSQFADLNSYRQLFNLLKIGSVNALVKGDHKITSINYEHPILIDVFEKKITNFQYPKINLHYSTNIINSSPILKLDNNQPFISSKNIENGIFYWISSPLHNDISNLTQSSLVVPVFYNIAKKSLKLAELYHTIKPDMNLEIKTSIGKDKVLKFSNGNTTFIPLQKVLQNKVNITLHNDALKSGFYEVIHNNKTIETLAFNYNRKESDLSFVELNKLISKTDNVEISDFNDEIFTQIQQQQQINWLFKWFFAFSILFLLVEMLILKYFKQ